MHKIKRVLCEDAPKSSVAFICQKKLPFPAKTEAGGQDFVGIFSELITFRANIYLEIIHMINFQEIICKRFSIIYGHK